MTVPKTYKDYSSNSSVQQVTIYMERQWDNDYVKLQILMTIVFSMLLYTAVTWTVNKKDEKKTTCI